MDKNGLGWVRLPFHAGMDSKTHTTFSGSLDSRKHCMATSDMPGMVIGMIVMIVISMIVMVGMVVIIIVMIVVDCCYN